MSSAANGMPKSPVSAEPAPAQCEGLACYREIARTWKRPDFFFWPARALIIFRTPDCRKQRGGLWITSVKYHVTERQIDRCPLIGHEATKFASINCFRFQIGKADET